jgi:hypothetical protein
VPLDSKFAVSNPVEGDGFLKAIKIYSTPSFGREVKPSAPCRNIFRNVKEFFEVYKILLKAKLRIYFVSSF